VRFADQLLAREAAHFDEGVVYVRDDAFQIGAGDDVTAARQRMLDPGDGVIFSHCRAKPLGVTAIEETPGC